MDFRFTRHALSCNNIKEGEIFGKDYEPGLSIVGIIETAMFAQENSDVFDSYDVCVSNLYRTWCTAFILYGTNMKQKGTILNLWICPYLKEKAKDVIITTLTRGNYPKDIQHMASKFLKFLQVLYQIKEIKKDDKFIKEINILQNNLNNKKSKLNNNLEYEKSKLNESTERKQKKLNESTERKKNKLKEETKTLEEEKRKNEERKTQANNTTKIQNKKFIKQQEKFIKQLNYQYENLVKEIDKKLKELNKLDQQNQEQNEKLNQQNQEQNEKLDENIKKLEASVEFLKNLEKILTDTNIYSEWYDSLPDEIILRFPTQKYPTKYSEYTKVDNNIIYKKVDNKYIILKNCVKDDFISGNSKTNKEQWLKDGNLNQFMKWYNNIIPPMFNSKTIHVITHSGTMRNYLGALGINVKAIKENDNDETPIGKTNCWTFVTNQDVVCLNNIDSKLKTKTEIIENLYIELEEKVKTLNYESVQSVLNSIISEKYGDNANQYKDIKPLARLYLLMNSLKKGVTENPLAKQIETISKKENMSLCSNEESVQSAQKTPISCLTGMEGGTRRRKTKRRKTRRIKKDEIYRDSYYQ